MKKTLVSALAIFCLMVLLATSAFATVTFNPATGTGFVGKGDVQQALGWNNKTLQNNAANLEFTYVANVEYEVVLTWTTGPDHNRKTHTISEEISYSINDTVAYDSRGSKQVTGFILNGFDSITNVGTAPSIGDTIDNKTVESVTLVSISTGCLKVIGVPLQ